MFMSIQAIREERAKLGGQIRSMADTLAKENRDFNGEEKANWEKLNKDFDSLGDRIATLERAERVGQEMEARKDNKLPGLENRKAGAQKEKRNDSEGDSSLDSSILLAAWALGSHAPEHIVKQSRAVMKKRGMSRLPKFLDINVQQRVSTPLGVGSDGIGGALVPRGFVDQFNVAMKSFAGPRQVADIMTTSSGNPMDWPTGDDTSNTGELLAENTSVTIDNEPTFTKKTFSAYKFSSKMIKVAYELLEDEAIAGGLESLLARYMGERIGRSQNPYLTTGTGSSQPEGIVTGAILGKTTASATALTADELIDLFYSVDPAYRNNPNVNWMMHNSIMAVVRKLKDGQGQYLWQQPIQAGQPELLLGKPVILNQAMASALSSTNKTALFGDMSYYKIRDVNSLRVRRLVERYAESDQVAFVAFTRMDAKMLNGSSGPVKFLQQAA